MLIRSSLKTIRDGFTLIEMLVVLAIILALASITALFLPSILRSDKLAQGANAIQGMLLVARQRALAGQAVVSPGSAGVSSGQVCCGVRFFVVPDPVVNTRHICTEIAYIEKPNDYVFNDTLSFSGSVGTFGVTDFSGGLGSIVGPINSATSGNILAEEFLVQAGDYLAIPYSTTGGGIVSMITDVSQTGGSGPYKNLKVLNVGNYGSVTSPNTYGIIRAPRRTRGEDSVKLPSDIVIFINDSAVTSAYPSPPNNFVGSQNIPQRTVPLSVNGVTPPTAPAAYYDILFGPTGSVMGTDTGNSGGNLIKIWVWDSGQDTGSLGWQTYISGNPVYVVVSPLTGMIAIQPVNITGTPTGTGFDTFTTDQHISGM